MNYAEFLTAKMSLPDERGVDPGELSPQLMPHQRDLVRWALRKGRAAIFADTGLGKTLMQLEWARRISEHGRVLVLAPLAVASQTVAEGRRFGIDCEYAREDSGGIIVVTNYEMLDAFDPSQFVGVVLDESSILKAYDGKTRNAIIGTFADTPYKLACTATPAPNDFTELGNHSEFLGVRSRAEMLSEFFVHDGGSTQDWRLKGHAVGPFWDWVSSWGAIVRSPEDLGHDGGAYKLPPLRMHEHVVAIDHQSQWESGNLFAPQASGLADARKIRRETLESRARKVAELCAGDEPAVVWCELNAEADLCERLIEGAVQIKGSDSLDVKQERLEGFAAGRYRVLVTKPKIAGHGLNWQHCAKMAFFGASYSFEQTYQAIRRSWRFGQQRPVDVHILRAENEEHVIAAYRRKEADAERLASEMASRVRPAVRADVAGESAPRWNEYNPNLCMEIPRWLKAA